MDYQTLTGIIVSLCLSAFFSGSEIAFVSANKLHIELKSKSGFIPARILSNYFIKYSSYFLAILLLGNTVALVVYGIYMANFLDPWIVSWLPEFLNNDFNLMLIQTIISTIVVLVFAEFLPKSIFMINPDRLIMIVAVPLFPVFIITFIPAWLAVQISKFVIKNIFKLEYSEDKPVFGAVDLNNYIINISTGDDKNQENEIDTKIFSNALLFRNIRVRDCMVPRTDMTTIDQTENIEKLKETFVRSGHSKILVYEESIDDIIGYIHVSRLFENPRAIYEDIISPIVAVPEATLAQELLMNFINENKSIALVVDEFGGTSGIVTMEDVMEEIFGEIQDEYDKEDWKDVKIDTNIFELSARQEIDYVNDKYGWELPEGDYDTLGGFILSIYEDIPKANDVIEYNNFKFTVLETKNNRIDTLEIIVTEKEIED